MMGDCMRDLRVILFLLAGAATSCMHSIHQQYVGTMDANVDYSKGRWVSAESKEFVILGFQSDTQYVEQAYKNLEAKCSGRIAQVTTEHLTSFKFLSYDQKVVMKGWCLG